jgi:hypothetical protein
VVCASLAYVSSLYSIGSLDEAGYVPWLANSQVGSMDGCCP